jgi:hypothetical protein
MHINSDPGVHKNVSVHFGGSQKKLYYLVVRIEEKVGNPWSSGQGRGLKLSGCGFKPLRHILDGAHKASYYIGKNKLMYPNVAHHQKKYI